MPFYNSGKESSRLILFWWAPVPDFLPLPVLVLPMNKYLHSDTHIGPQRGLHSEYQMISFNQWTEAQQWAYMASHISRVRWEMPPLPLYYKLGTLLEGKDYYILTSNVDRQFLRSGFPTRRVFEYQGSYDLLCCSQGCTAQVWPFYLL